MASPQIIELSKEVDKNTFNKWRDKVKDKKKYDKETNEHYALAEDGVIVHYHKTDFKSKIKLLLNPTLMVGSDDGESLWEPKKKNIRLVRQLLISTFIQFFIINDTAN